MNNVLLYGGGTQSTGLLLMCLEGRLSYKLDYAIFADPGGEPDHVIDYIHRVDKYVKKKFGFKITIVNNGSLEDSLLNKESYERTASLPLFTGNGGMIRRQCTNEYKIVPITKFIKKEFDISRKSKTNNEYKVNMLFGISLDEIERCRENREWWAKNVYPLVEERIYRHETIDYINKNHPELKDPPRSACYFCPFRTNVSWLQLKTKYPHEFEKAVKIDKAIRRHDRMDNSMYLHRSLKPLDEVKFHDSQIDIFGECEGYCGV